MQINEPTESNLSTSSQTNIEQVEEAVAQVSQEQMMSAINYLQDHNEEVVPEALPNPQVDLAKAALEVQNNSLVQEEFRNPASNSVTNQDISWYNQGVALIEAGKYAEALSCLIEHYHHSRMMMRW